MNEIKVLSKTEVFNKEFTVYGTTETPLFLAKDVAEMIDYAKMPNGSYNVSMMLQNIDEDEKMISKIFISSKNRDVWFLTENGVYEVLMQSTKPIAKAFKKEVKKVLHSLRVNGGYITGQEKLSETEILAKAVLVAQNVIESKNKELAEKNKQIETMRPKVNFFDTVVSSDNAKSMQEVAGFLNVGRNKLFAMLRDKGILNRYNIPYRPYIENGYFKVVETSNIDRYGNVHVTTTTLVYQKGIEYIVNKVMGCKSE